VQHVVPVSALGTAGACASAAATPTANLRSKRKPPARSSEKA
jgi:hypothetical protein